MERGRDVVQELPSGTAGESSTNERNNKQLEMGSADVQGLAFKL